jgi:hypothetical protein
MMEFSDQDLRLVLNRALRSVAIAVAIGIPVIWIAWGWRSMLLFLVGGAIAATSILEWRQLMTAVLERLDLGSGSPLGNPKPLGAVLFWFFIRFAAAAGVLYVSLRSLDGKVAALLIGLALALAALLMEALRLLRGWAA